MTTTDELGSCGLEVTRRRPLALGVADRLCNRSATFVVAALHTRVRSAELRVEGGGRIAAQIVAAPDETRHRGSFAVAVVVGEAGVTGMRARDRRGRIVGRMSLRPPSCPARS